MIQNNNSKETPATGNFTPEQFAGHYTSTGQTYYQNNTSGYLVKLCERKQPTALKPRLYLVQRTADGKFPFLSSLYPRVEKDTYTAEIKRVYFIVEFNQDTLNVSVIAKG